MPATEETYRSQPTLHLVFALTSIGMMLSFVWMIAADHLRPWKGIQREFQQIEREKLEADGSARSWPSSRRSTSGEIAAIDAQIKAAAERKEQRAGEVRAARRQAQAARRQGPGARHPQAVQEGRARQPAEPL